METVIGWRAYCQTRGADFNRKIESEWRCEFGHLRVGVGLGPGYGGEDLFYLNLQTFVGFDF